MTQRTRDGAADREAARQRADAAAGVNRPSDPSGAVPPGHRIELPGRGVTFVRDVAGPDGAATVVLVHGLGATTSINWPGAFEALSRHYRVVGLDQIGHGRGIRSSRPFRLEDCADDVVRLADVLGVERVVPVGYSMGGPVAMLVRKRHPSRVSGLVLCATSARFARTEIPMSPMSAAMVASLRLAPPMVRGVVHGTMMEHLGRSSPMPSAFVDEMRRHDPAAVLEALDALGVFDARRWLGDLRCPTASVVTTLDRLVPASQQLDLARATNAAIYTVQAGHEVAVRDPGRFLPALVAACESVIDPRPTRTIL